MNKRNKRSIVGSKLRFNDDYALNFDGNNDLINTNHNFGYVNDNTDWSISLFFSRKDLLDGEIIDNRVGNPNSTIGFGIYLSGTPTTIVFLTNTVVGFVSYNFINQIFNKIKEEAELNI